jgi:hypothetical protein
MNLTPQGRIEADAVLAAVGPDFEPTYVIARRSGISAAKVRQVLPKMISILEWRLVRTPRGGGTVPVYEWRRKASVVKPGMSKMTYR